MNLSELPGKVTNQVTPANIGWLGFGVSFFLYLGDIGKLITQFQNWEFRTTTQFIGALLELTGHYGAAALGGGGAVVAMIKRDE